MDASALLFLIPFLFKKTSSGSNGDNSSPDYPTDGNIYFTTDPKTNQLVILTNKGELGIDWIHSYVSEKDLSLLNRLYGMKLNDLYGLLSGKDYPNTPEGWAANPFDLDNHYENSDDLNIANLVLVLRNQPPLFKTHKTPPDNYFYKKNVDPWWGAVSWPPRIHERNIAIPTAPVTWGQIAGGNTYGGPGYFIDFDRQLTYDELNLLNYLQTITGRVEFEKAKLMKKWTIMEKNIFNMMAVTKSMAIPFNEAGLYMDFLTRVRQKAASGGGGVVNPPGGGSAGQNTGGTSNPGAV